MARAGTAGQPATYSRVGAVPRVATIGTADLALLLYHHRAAYLTSDWGCHGLSFRVRIAFNVMGFPNA